MKIHRYVLSGHSLEGTHLLESSSMIVPLGHVHTPVQTRSKGLKKNLLAQVVGNSSPHGCTICPSTVQFPVNG